MTGNLEKVNAVIARLIDVEGGYSDDSKDLGGKTRYGITEVEARAFGYDGPMHLLAKSQARSIYLRRYWIAPGFNRVHDFYPALAEELFDSGVNQGTAMAGAYLQRALNIFNSEARLFPDLEVDGRVGNLTIAALAAYRKHRGAAGEAVLVRACDCLQGARYFEITEARPANERFAYGWFANRIGAA